MRAQKYSLRGLGFQCWSYVYMSWSQYKDAKHQISERRSKIIIAQRRHVPTCTVFLLGGTHGHMWQTCKAPKIWRHLKTQSRVMVRGWLMCEIENHVCSCWYINMLLILRKGEGHLMTLHNNGLITLWLYCTRSVMPVTAAVHVENNFSLPEYYGWWPTTRAILSVLISIEIATSSWTLRCDKQISRTST